MLHRHSCHTNNGSHDDVPAIQGSVAIQGNRNCHCDIHEGPVLTPPLESLLPNPVFLDILLTEQTYAQAYDMHKHMTCNPALLIGFPFTPLRRNHFVEREIFEK